MAKGDSYHQKPYQFADQMENILLSLLLLALGGFIATSGIQLASMNSVIFAVLFLLLVRPLAGLLSLKTVRFKRIEKRAIAFLGIRGFGSFYYLAYAQNHGMFDDIDVLWQVTTVVVLASLSIHGATATLAMRRLDKSTVPNQ